MVQYLSKFSPRIAKIAEPLWDLMKKHAPYAWGPKHNQAFDNIKREIVQAPILKYYDPKKETVLKTDASIKGLGACLLQDGHPVYFASKSLQDAECRYITIELEALAVAWVNGKISSFPICLTFYSGNWSEAIRNHPQTKSLTEATLWLQWLLICIFPYDFSVRYIKGSTNQLADCLSRLGCQKDKLEQPKVKIHAITRQLPATADLLNQFCTETAQDEELVLLKHTVQTGWPQDIHVTFCRKSNLTGPSMQRDDYRRWSSTEGNLYYHTPNLA